MKRGIAIAALTGSAIANPTTLHAQGVPAQSAPDDVDTDVAAGGSDKRVYVLADFERYAPKTALDMVRQIPGFTLRSQVERRGLGDATENVLINGKRISGKSNDAITALGRISASDVTRIEVVDGATLDVPGLSGQVVNIMTSVGQMTGNFRWSPQFRAKRVDPRLLNGEISVSGKSGAFDYTLSLSDNQRRQGNAGVEIATDGLVQTDRRFEVLTIKQDVPKLTGMVKYEGVNGDIANFNASVERDKGIVDEQSYRSFPGTVDRHRNYRETEREWNYEVGGDYEFGLGGGRLKLIGLRRFEHSPYVTYQVFDYADGSADTGNLYNRTVDEGEWIGRAEYRWKTGSADWMVSAEGAYNILDSTSSLYWLDSSGAYQPFALSNANSRVEEKRGELALNYGRPLTSNLTLQAKIGAEYSNIRQSSVDGLNRTFYRPKGFVSLAWKASSTLDLSFKVERAVGQLDFYDFISFVNLASGGGDAGNPEIRPPQSWNLELEGTKTFAPWGSLTLNLYGKSYSDAVVQVPIGDYDQAPGNINGAWVVGTSWNATLNFDPIGWKGAKLDVNGQYRHSRLRDPLTGKKVAFSQDTEYEISVTLRHDIPRTNWAWGVEYYDNKTTPDIRLDQIAYIGYGPSDLGAYVENKNILGLKVRAGVYNLTGVNELYSRTVYDGRRTDPILFTEARDRHSGLIFSFDISGSF